MTTLATELTRLIADPRRKQWCILKLEGKPAAATWNEQTSPAIRDAHELRARVRDGMRGLFKTRVVVETHDNALWAGVELLCVGYRKDTVGMFLVHYPHSDFVFASTLFMKQVQSHVHDALAFVFRCRSVRQVNCVGSDLSSLADLALHPLSQGAFGAYRLYKALLAIAASSRAFHHENGHHNDNNDNDNDDDDDDEENEAERRRRRARVRDHMEALAEAEAELGMVGSPTHALVVDERRFGTRHVSTTGALDKAQRAVEARGTKSLTDVTVAVDAPLEWNGASTPFSCRVTLSGTAVVAGVRGLAKTGLLSTSVPEQVADASAVISSALVAPREVKKPRRNNRAAASAAGEDEGGGGDADAEEVEALLEADAQTAKWNGEFVRAVRVGMRRAQHPGQVGRPPRAVVEARLAKEQREASEAEKALLAAVRSHQSTAPAAIN